MCLTNLHLKNAIGSYFIDDLSVMHMGNRTDKSKHILMQELLPQPVRESASYIHLQLEHLHL